MPASLFTDAVLKPSSERYKADRSFPLKTAQANPRIQKNAVALHLPRIFFISSTAAAF